MKVLLVISLIAVVGVVICEKYTTKYDNVDLDEIIKSDRLLKNYIDCIMERGKCTPDGQELKRHISDALQTECSKCSERQKEGTKKILKHLVKSKRPWFDELSGKYDPEGHYRARYKSEFEKEGITL